MSYDAGYVIAQIKRVIDTAPTYVDIYSEKYVSDGYGGKKKVTSSSTLGVKCVFDNASSPSISITASEGGRVLNQTSPKLYIPFSDTLKMKRGDVVKINSSGRHYVITEVNNLLEQNLLFIVTLELRD